MPFFPNTRCQSLKVDSGCRFFASSQVANIVVLHNLYHPAVYMRTFHKHLNVNGLASLTVLPGRNRNDLEVTPGTGSSGVLEVALGAPVPDSTEPVGGGGLGLRSAPGGSGLRSAPGGHTGGGGLRSGGGGGGLGLRSGVTPDLGAKGGASAFVAVGFAGIGFGGVGHAAGVGGGAGSVGFAGIGFGGVGASGGGGSVEGSSATSPAGGAGGGPSGLALGGGPGFGSPGGEAATGGSAGVVRGWGAADSSEE